MIADFTGSKLFAVARRRVVSQIRKLLRLAESQNPHEASLAREEAERLLRGHGLRAADLEEEPIVTEIVDRKRTHHREHLAHAVATSRGCTARVNEHDWIAIRGRRRAAEDAKALYESIVAHGERACEESLKTVSMPPAHDLARLRFWYGYALTVGARLEALTTAAPPVATQVTIEVVLDEPPTDEPTTSAPHDNPDGGDVKEDTEEPEPPVDAPAAPAGPTFAEVERDTLKARVHESFERLVKGMPIDNAQKIVFGIVYNGLLAGQSAGRVATLWPWNGVSRNNAAERDPPPTTFRGYLATGDGNSRGI